MVDRVERKTASSPPGQRAACSSTDAPKRPAAVSGKEAPVLRARRHGVNHELIAAVKDQYDGLQQPRLCVEAEPQFTVRPVLIVKRFDPCGQSSACTASSLDTPCLSALG